LGVYPGRLTYSLGLHTLAALRQSLHQNRIIGLGLPNEGDQIANQFRPKKVHRREAISAKSTAPSLFTLSVSKVMEIPKLLCFGDRGPLFRPSVPGLDGFYGVFKRLF
jgi:hypothetical protein